MEFTKEYFIPKIKDSAINGSFYYKLPTHPIITQDFKFAADEFTAASIFYYTDKTVFFPTDDNDEFILTGAL